MDETKRMLERVDKTLNQLIEKEPDLFGLYRFKFSEMILIKELLTAYLVLLYKMENTNDRNSN